MRLHRMLCAAVTFGLAACAPVATSAGAQDAGAEPAASATPSGAANQETLVPAGYGSLRQDAITVPLKSGSLLIKVTPLDESIIRLAAPDTYQRLHATAESRLAEARQAVNGDEPTMLLVSFFSYDPDVAYRPDDLQVVYQGRVLRPAAILPITSGWGRGQLQQRELQSAVYVFAEPINFDLPFTIRYGTEQADDWAGLLPRIQTERARVRASAGA